MMYLSVYLWCLIACVIGRSCNANGEAASYHVTLHVFSGTRDPVWILEPDSSGYAFLTQYLPDHNTTLAGRLGYSGYTVEKYEGSQRQSTTTIGRCTLPLFEGDLFSVVKTLTPVGQHGALQPAVVDYVTQEIAEC